MTKVVLLTALLLTSHLLLAQYKPVDNGSEIKFKIKNFGINTRGSFRGLQGNINFDINRLEDANFDVSIDAGTIDTDNEMRDNHLRGDTYFDVKNYPRIHFVSTKVTAPGKPGMMIIFGKLSIKNHTKEISFPFTAAATNDGYVFKGMFTINRRDFEVGGASIVSDNLEVQLSITAKK